MSTCSVLEFLQSVPPYRKGERAGFSAEQAELYVQAKVAKIIAANVPIVDPAVVASDAKTRLQALRSLLSQAEADAMRVSQDPNAGATAQEALDLAQQVRRSLEALAAQLVERPPVEAREARRPPPSSRAA